MSWLDESYLSDNLDGYLNTPTHAHNMNNINVSRKAQKNDEVHRLMAMMEHERAVRNYDIMKKQNELNEIKTSEKNINKYSSSIVEPMTSNVLGHNSAIISLSKNDILIILVLMTLILIIISILNYRSTKELIELIKSLHTVTT